MTTSQQPDAPKPAAPKPGVVTPAAVTPVAPVAPTPAYTSDIEEAKQFAEVSAEGVVTLLDGDEKVEVGQVPDASEQDALAYYVRKYDEVMTQLQLLKQRLDTDVANQELEKTLNQIDELIIARQMVGDMTKLREFSKQLRDQLAERRAKQQAEREKALAEQQAAREKIVERAEKLAEQDPDKTQWKHSTAQMRQLFDEWRDVQKSGPRLPRATEDDLWKRFRSARNTFEKNRRAFFSQLDARNAEAKKTKEDLIARAEALQDSTDWGPTTLKYRDLMNEWKKSPRASRKDDDALWTRFRAAQDVFFQARDAANAEVDREYEANLKVKEQILQDAQQHLPFKNLETARKVMQDVRKRWDDAGRVPRKDMSRMEGELSKLERAFNELEQEHWRKTDPETKARTNSALVQLEESIAQLEADLAAAQEAGDEQKIAAAQEALDARRQWLDVVRAAGE
ncbi:hypothetical protein GCM10023190_02770 [Enteractinococcus fodinae]|uniref:Regulator of replication initiation timing n=1 Tax=Enteractinococcus fodinae TaxID=684663 RepID=A0ABU2B0W8_9MICC|nr:DUF349 domain-containing protein [Enteractinococcus fodinae]MDR7347245.1 regulator of replication initiation timing [Enteractinococcus fodinae]